MPLIQSKQISKLVASRVSIAGHAFTAGAGVSTSNLTVDLTAVLTTAGQGGVPVPLQQYISGTQAGVVTAGPNILEIYDSGTKQKIAADTAAGEEVYGRVTFAAGVYTLNLFTEIAGVETAYVPAANLTLDVEVPYVFTFELLPETALLKVKSVHVDDDAGGGNSDPRTFTEVLTVTALNTVGAGLTNIYTTGPAWLSVNGQYLSTLDGSFTLTAGAQTFAWNPLVAGYNLNTTDVLVIRYPY